MEQSSVRTGTSNVQTVIIMQNAINPAWPPKYAMFPASFVACIMKPGVIRGENFVETESKLWHAM